MGWGGVLSGHLRPDQFLDHLTVIKIYSTDLRKLCNVIFCFADVLQRFDRITMLSLPVLYSEHVYYMTF